MRMAAAELHEAIDALGPRFGGDRRGDGAGEFAVAILVDIFHGAASAPTAPASRNSASVRSASSDEIRLNA